MKLSIRFAVFAALSLASSGEAQQHLRGQGNHEHLREQTILNDENLREHTRARQLRNSDVYLDVDVDVDIDFLEVVFDSDSVPDDVEVEALPTVPPARVLVECPEDCSMVVVKDVLAGVGGKFLYDLPSANAVAASVPSEKLEALKRALPGNYQVEEDRPRSPLHIRGSVEILTDEEIERGDGYEYNEGADGGGDHRHLQNLANAERTYGLEMVNAPAVWREYGATGAGVKVCVIDSGILATHRDLDRGNIDGYSGSRAVQRWDADRSGHGTHVAGTVAAQPDGRGVAGVAPDAEIYVVRVFGDDGRYYGSSIIAAGQECVNAGADIISMSLGGPGGSFAEQRFFDRLEQKGILAIAASGNDGDGPNYMSYPASYGNVMSVAAVDRNRNIASFSTHNEMVDVAAPGVRVRSTWNTGGYAAISGTSMATPHASGVAALLKSYDRSLTASRIADAMQRAAGDRGARGRDRYYGWGVVDALASIRYLEGGSVPVPVPVPAPVPAPTPKPPTGNPEKGGGQCVDTEILVITDATGYENGFSLRRADTNEAIFLEPVLQSNRRYTRNKCLLRTLCYRFVILDTYGDGILGVGRGAQVRYGDQIVYSRRNFGRGEVVFFGGGCQ